MLHKPLFLINIYLDIKSLERSVEVLSEEGWVTPVNNLNKNESNEGGEEEENGQIYEKKAVRIVLHDLPSLTRFDKRAVILAARFVTYTNIAKNSLIFLTVLDSIFHCRPGNSKYS